MSSLSSRSGSLKKEKSSKKTDQVSFSDLHSKQKHSNTKSHDWKSSMTNFKNIKPVKLSKRRINPESFGNRQEMSLDKLKTRLLKIHKKSRMKGGSRLNFQSTTGS